MKSWAFLLLFIGILPAGARAFDISGIQPVAPNGVFSTFSAESLARGRAGLELTLERSKEPDFYRLRASAAYGLTDSVELNLTAPYVLRADGSRDGMEDVRLGFKHRFYEEGTYGPSLAYLLMAALHNGREEFSTHGGFGGGLILSKRVGPFKGHLNVLYERPGTGRLGSEVSIRGGIEFSAAHSFKLLAEVIARKSNSGNHYDLVETRFGYRIAATDNIFTALGVGVDLKKRAPEYRVLLSVGLLTPVARKPITTIYEEE